MMSVKNKNEAIFIKINDIVKNSDEIDFRLVVVHSTNTQSNNFYIFCDDGHARVQFWKFCPH